MLLSDCKRGEIVEIIAIQDNWAREQIIRFGLVQGVKVSCQSTISKGPIVIKKGNQNIAIGYNVAKKVRVKRRWR